MRRIADETREENVEKIAEANSLLSPAKKAIELTDEDLSQSQDSQPKKRQKSTSSR